ncbi:MAG: hypothetical protein V4621_08025 [Pseudomonadota bacterium]
MAIILPSRYQNAATRQADMTQDMTDLANVVAQINLGLAPAIFGFLDGTDSVASVSIPTVPTVFTVPTVSSSNNNILFNTVTGVITIAQSGTYQSVFLLNAFNTVATTIFFATEVDTGSGFVAIPNSGRQMNINTNINGQVIFVSNNFFAAGTRLRVYIWCSSASAIFQTTSLAALPGGAVSVLAKRVLISGQSNL